MKLRNKKTGDIAEVLTDTIAVNVLIDRQDITGYYDSLAELNAEWEDYEEPKDIWWLDNEGYVNHATSEVDNNFEKNREIGNYFKTKEEAEKAVEKLKAWKRLKDKGFQFHGYNALGCGEITFYLDFEGLDDENKVGQLRHDLDLLFGNLSRR